MEQEILAKFEEQEIKLEQIYVSVEKTRKYFLWTLVVTIVMFILPLVGILAIIPWFAGTIMNTYNIQ